MNYKLLPLFHEKLEKLRFVDGPFLRPSPGIFIQPWSYITHFRLARPLPPSPSRPSLYLPNKANKISFKYIELLMTELLFSGVSCRLLKIVSKACRSPPAGKIRKRPRCHPLKPCQCLVYPGTPNTRSGV